MAVLTLELPQCSSTVWEQCCENGVYIYSQPFLVQLWNWAFELKDKAPQAYLAQAYRWVVESMQLPHPDAAFEVAYYFSEVLGYLCSLLSQPRYFDSVPLHWTADRAVFADYALVGDDWIQERVSL